MEKIRISELGIQRNAYKIGKKHVPACTLGQF